MCTQQIVEDFILRNSKYQAKEQLGLIHINVCGAITPESFNGKRYFISFVDDFS